MRDRRVEFLLDQLVNFYTLRREFDACMEVYTGRLREEAAGVRVSSPTRGSIWTWALRRRLVIAAGIVRWLCRIPMYAQQLWRLSRQVRPAGRGSDVVLATSGVRLSAAEVDVRAYFVALTKPFSPACDPGAGRDIADAPRLVVSDVIEHSPLWTRRHACWADNVLIVDSAFALFVGVQALCTFRAPVLLGCLHHWRVYRSRRGAGTGILDVFRELVVGGLLTEGYRRVLPTAPYKAYVLTSNSFATEVQRFQLFIDPRCESICEIMHGIPTIVWEQYVAAMLEIADRYGVAGKHSSISQLPDLPMFGVLTTDVRLPAAAAINTYLNRYWIQRGGDSDAFVEREFGRLFAGRQLSDRTLVVTFIGGNSQYRDPYHSEALVVERMMMRHTLSVLDRLGQQYVAVYTPHPCYGMEAFLTDPFFEETGIILFPDTVATWLVCDLAIGLLSSAMWEAAYFGAHAFTATIPSDGMYPALLLDLIDHPAKTGRDGLMEALTAFLERHAVGRESCDLFDRAVRRARRSSGLELEAPVAALVH